MITVDLKINMQVMQAHEANQKWYKSPLGTSAKTLMMLFCDILGELNSQQKIVSYINQEHWRGRPTLKRIWSYYCRSNYIYFLWSSEIWLECPEILNVKTTYDMLWLVVGQFLLQWIHQVIINSYN